MMQIYVCSRIFKVWNQLFLIIFPGIYDSKRQLGTPEARLRFNQVMVFILQFFAICFQIYNQFFNFSLYAFLNFSTFGVMIMVQYGLRLPTLL